METCFFSFGAIPGLCGNEKVCVSVVLHPQQVVGLAGNLGVILGNNGVIIGSPCVIINTTTHCTLVLIYYKKYSVDTVR